MLWKGQFWRKKLQFDCSLVFSWASLVFHFPNRLCFATMSKKPKGKRLNERQRCKIISSNQPQSQMQKKIKTYAKWRFTTCSTNKSWTLTFLLKNAYSTRMRTETGTYLSRRLLYVYKKYSCLSTCLLDLKYLIKVQSSKEHSFAPSNLLLKSI